MANLEVDAKTSADDDGIVDPAEPAVFVEPEIAAIDKHADVLVFEAADFSTYSEGGGENAAAVGDSTYPTDGVYGGAD